MIGIGRLWNRAGFSVMAVSVFALYIITGSTHGSRNGEANFCRAEEASSIFSGHILTISDRTIFTGFIYYRIVSILQVADINPANY